MNRIFVVTMMWVLGVSFFALIGSAQSDTLIRIETPKGVMIFEFHEESPKHKQHFIELANQHYWDTLTFNRVIENFVIQGGCPDTEEGFADSPYLLEEEIHPNCRHVFGALGAGRDMNPEKTSAYCQFYIIHHPEGVHRLDGDYTVFGQIIEGEEVLEALGKVPTNELDEPLKPLPMKVEIIYIK